MKRLGLAVFGILLTGAAQGATCTSAYCSGVIESLYITDTDVLVKFSGGVSGLSTCTPQSSVYITLVRDSNVAFNTYFSALLAAQMSAKPIDIRVVDGVSPCRVAYMVTY